MKTSCNTDSQIWSMSLHGTQRSVARRSPSHQIAGMHSSTRPITTSEQPLQTDLSLGVFTIGRSLQMLAQSTSSRSEWQPNRLSMLTRAFRTTNLDLLTMVSDSLDIQTTQLESPMVSSLRKKVSLGYYSIWTSALSVSAWTVNTWVSLLKTSC